MVLFEGNAPSLMPMSTTMPLDGVSRTVRTCRMIPIKRPSLALAEYHRRCELLSMYIGRGSVSHRKKSRPESAGTASNCWSDGPKSKFWSDISRKAASALPRGGACSPDPRCSAVIRRATSDWCRHSSIMTRAFAPIAAEMKRAKPMIRAGMYEPNFGKGRRVSMMCCQEIAPRDHCELGRAWRACVIRLSSAATCNCTAHKHNSTTTTAHHYCTCTTSPS